MAAVGDVAAGIGRGEPGRAEPGRAELELAEPDDVSSWEPPPQAEVSVKLKRTPMSNAFLLRPFAVRNERTFLHTLAQSTPCARQRIGVAAQDCAANTVLLLFVCTFLRAALIPSESGGGQVFSTVCGNR